MKGFYCIASCFKRVVSNHLEYQKDEKAQIPDGIFWRAHKCLICDLVHALTAAVSRYLQFCMMVHSFAKS
jgi:hypothetical protein